LLAGVGGVTWKRLAWALALGYALIYLVALDNRPLQRLDEFRHAEVAREMLVSGDWIAPRLNGVRYLEKPVLGYWFNAVSQTIFGDSIFAVRFPSALSTGLTALFIVIFLSRFARTETAVFAGFVYLTCLYTFALGSTNILDPILNLWLTLAVGFYYWAYAEPVASRRLTWLALSGAACGLAFLAKGFLAFAVLVVVIVPFLMWQREWMRILRDAWLPLLVAGIVILPWGLLIAVREPDFWNYFFWVEHIQRFSSGTPQHPEPPWYFALRFPAMALPWVFVFPVALAGLRGAVTDKNLIAYLSLWFIMPFLFFSSSSGKLISYVLPCFPPFAMLVAVGTERFFGASKSDSAGNGVRNSVLGLLIVYALALGYLWLSARGAIGSRLFDDTETSRLIGALAALAFGIAVCALALWQRKDTWRLGLTGVSLLGVIIALPLVIPNATRLSKMPTEFFLRQKADLNEDFILVSDGAFFRSVAWVFERDDIYMLSPGELDYGLAYPDAQHRLLDGDGIDRLIGENMGKTEIVIIPSIETEVGLASRMPPGAQRTQEGRYIVWRIPVDAVADEFELQPGGSRN
jgi:4-amino-4-deoxy-L-arabinose transferase